MFHCYLPVWMVFFKLDSWIVQNVFSFMPDLKSVFLPDVIPHEIMNGYYQRVSMLGRVWRHLDTVVIPPGDPQVSRTKHNFCKISVC